MTWIMHAYIITFRAVLRLIGWQNHYAMPSHSRTVWVLMVVMSAPNITLAYVTVRIPVSWKAPIALVYQPTSVCLTMFLVSSLYQTVLRSHPLQTTNHPMVTSLTGWKWTHMRTHTTLMVSYVLHFITTFRTHSTMHHSAVITRLTP